MKPHPYYQAIIDLNREAGRPYFHQVTPAEARAMLRQATAAAPPPQDLPELTSIEDLNLAGPHGDIPVRIYVPAQDRGGTIVYFHSGGWVIGDIAFADTTCRRLADAARCRLVSVDYRLAPEHPYPQPLDDAFAALAWAAEQYGGPLVVAGESAGGNLAAACAIRARSVGGPALAGQWLAYPVTDHACDTPSHRDIGERNWLLSTADMRWFWDYYCPAGIDRADPELSPLRVANAAGLPPAMICVAQFDPLRDEGLAYGAKLACDGVAVLTRCDPEMVHGYLGAAGAIPAAREALIQSAQWMRVSLDAAASRPV